MEKTLDPPSSPTRKVKAAATKLPKLKKPPSNIETAVAKRAENRASNARFVQKTAELLTEKQEKELAAKRAAAKAARIAARAAGIKEKTGYWTERKGSIYMRAAREISTRHLREGDAVLDVGSNRTPTLAWHRKKARRLVSVDLRNPYSGPGIEAVTSDFFDYPTDPPFDLVTCYQVLEHIPDARAFAQRLLASGKTCVVSVPYKWRKGRCKYHIHDPVDEAKMLAWFGKQPVESFIAREEHKPSDRLICVYEGNPGMVAPQPQIRQIEKPRGLMSVLADAFVKLRRRA